MATGVPRLLALWEALWAVQLGGRPQGEQEFPEVSGGDMALGAGCWVGLGLEVAGSWVRGGSRERRRRSAPPETPGSEHRKSTPRQSERDVDSAPSATGPGPDTRPAGGAGAVGRAPEPADPGRQHLWDLPPASRGIRGDSAGGTGFHVGAWRRVSWAVCP